jgi:hypothetical protein
VWPFHSTDVRILCREWDNYEKLKVDHKDFRRRLKDKHARVAQLEAVLVDVSRTLEVGLRPTCCLIVVWFGVWHPVRAVGVRRSGPRRSSCSAKSS